MAIEDREVNERFCQSTIVERAGRNYWKVPQIYGGYLVGSWTLYRPIGGVRLGGNRMLDLATGHIFIYKRRGKLVLHSKGRVTDIGLEIRRHQLGCSWL